MNSNIGGTVEPLNVDTLKSGHLLYSGHFVLSQPQEEREVTGPPPNTVSLARLESCLLKKKYIA